MAETSLLLSLPFSFFEAGGGGELSQILIRLLIQLSVILIAAKVAGELATRFLQDSFRAGRAGVPES